MFPFNNINIIAIIVSMFIYSIFYCVCIQNQYQGKLNLAKKNHFCFVMPSSVAVIGAGIGGLSVAYHLIKSLNESQISNSLEPIPISITLFEARDRIGGRSFTCPETSIDLGATWIHHAYEDNPLYCFVLEKQMEIVNQTQLSGSQVFGWDRNEYKEVCRKFKKAFYDSIV
jgi:monoamine oxidase